jgi:ABC-type lipoprotein export system ATPase subunit
MNEAIDQPAIKLIGVTKTFDHGLIHALDDVSLSIKAQEWVALTGPSGSGKSTLLHLLAALDAPTSGEIFVNGRRINDISNIDEYRRHEVGLVFQLHNLLPNLNALQNVEIAMLGTGITHRESSERAHELLSDVGLTSRKTLRPPELSGGERQRVAIARALANGPSILLADEPTGSLDSSSAASVLDLFARIRNARRLTILLVTHDPQVASAADRVILMRDGRIAGTPAEREHGPAPADTQV